MVLKLSDPVVKSLAAPAEGNRIEYDSQVKGFGCRVTAAGVRAFVLTYRTTAGRQRKFTIGKFPDWSTSAARKAAAELKRRIDVGEDPLADVERARAAPTVAELCSRYESEHLPTKRSSSARNDRAMIARFVLPAWRHRTVVSIEYQDVDSLHKKITRGGAPFMANRVVALLGKMFTLAVRWKLRSDNPAKGIKRNIENRRERYLKREEIDRLSTALADHSDQQAANIIRLLLLTGARRGEVQAARWDQFDLSAGTWTKPSSHTKSKKVHHIPLSAPARTLLAEMKEAAPGALWLFPSLRAGGHRVEIKNDWKRLCKAAEITGCRMHDLRHSFASILVSGGQSLPMIGQLLGHTQAQTTARYAHLHIDPQRVAAEQVGAFITNAGKPTPDNVTELRQGSSR